MSDFEALPVHHGQRTFERPGSDIKKKGSLRKLKTMKKKFFVLRGTSSSGPARLEYYDSEKKFNLNHAPKRSIDLHTCFNINKRVDRKHNYAIALYTKDDCFTVLAENKAEQDDWLSVLLEYQLQYVYHDENREHFGELLLYSCSMREPSLSNLSNVITHLYIMSVGNKKIVAHVWQVNIKSKGLALSPEHKHLRGCHRLCLSSQNICIVKLNTDRPIYVFQLATVRSLGISDCLFRMEVGSMASTGPGELWMQVEDSSTAHTMHDCIFQ
ncbi:hypothetical protein LOTGIDRAFT_137373 [Lottia gigantea]|uniref:Insulin receptor substrate 1 n=1 Tax=Lottia gigantea TaxID=225164 RepID=V4BBL4_LOTGI|nr:hypothetical protein LOTGIDRAFT_137373 [Lottia gigantea]ESP03427.1 hypothetical protein LOTGIDRAFT_137373 [Lottia gigantea]